MRQRRNQTIRSPKEDNWPEIFASKKACGLSELGYYREDGIKCECGFEGEAHPAVSSHQIKQSTDGR